MTNTTINTNVLGAFVAAFIIISLIGSLSANAAPLDKITICHATSSDTNPFVTIHVSENATAGHFENNGTTKAGHEGDFILQGEVECPAPEHGGGGDNGGGGNNNNGGGGHSTSTPIGGGLSGTVTSTTTSTTTGSEVTGTLTGGSNSSSTISGTVVSGGGGATLTGTVTGGGGSTPGVPNTGGGGGGGGSSPTVIDYCPNIDGIQASLPAGQGIQNGICVALSNGGSPGGVGGGNGEVLGEQSPGIPNTGAGGNAAQNMLVLVASGLAALASGMILRRSYFI